MNDERLVGPYPPGTFVYHWTHGPGRVTDVTGNRVHVLFAGAESVPFRVSHAAEALTACPPGGFIAQCLTDPASALQLLRTSPRRALALLVHELGRDLNTRQAKPVIRSLRLVADTDFGQLWASITTQLKKTKLKTRKTRLAEGETISIDSPSQARALATKLWDTAMRVADRMSIYSALARFHGEPWSEDFFLETALAPLPKNPAFAELQRHGKLAEVWAYLLRKRADPRSAPGILETLFRLLDDRAQEQLQIEPRAAAAVFLRAARALDERERLDVFTRLAQASKATVVRVAKELLADAEASSLIPELRRLPPENRERLAELAIEDAPVRSSPPVALFRVIGELRGRFTEMDVIRVARNALGLQRDAYARAVLAAAAGLARSGEFQASEELASWIRSEPRLIDQELRGTFRELGLEIDPRLEPVSPEEHQRRVLDRTLAVRIREKAAAAWAPGADRDSVANVLAALLRRGPEDRALADHLWTVLKTGREVSERLAVLAALLGNEEASGDEWPVTILESERLSDRLVESITAAITNAARDEPLARPVRMLLRRLSGGSTGALLRRSLLRLVRSEATSTNSRPTAQLLTALADLGVPADVTAEVHFALGEADADRKRLESAVADHERRREVERFSEDMRAEMRAQIVATVSAKLAEARSEWELSLDKLRHEAAAWCADFETLAAGIETSSVEGSLRAVLGTLRRRLATLIESRLDLVLHGTVGSSVVFEPELYEGGARPGDTVIVVRPALVSKKSGRAVEKGLVRLM